MIEERIELVEAAVRAVWPDADIRREEALCGAAVVADGLVRVSVVEGAHAKARIEADVPWTAEVRFAPFVAVKLRRIFEALKAELETGRPVAEEPEETLDDEPESEPEDAADGETED